MLKKVHILNPSETSCSEKKEIQCTVCDSVAKSILYVCESGHVICKDCTHSDSIVEDNNEGGDYIPEKEFSSDDDKKESKIKNSDAKAQDLASGDHDGALVLVQKTNFEAKEDCRVDNTIFIKKAPHSQGNSKTVIEYVNANYKESNSSGTSNLDITKDTKSKEEEIQNCRIVPRPVVCPVRNCSKMVTIDSIMLHFHFDHSKVPRIILDETTPQEVSLKSTSFSTETQCVATFIIDTQKRQSKIVKQRLESVSSARNSLKDNKLLLLMAVRLPTNPIKMPSIKSDTSRTFTRSIHTQTEKLHKNDLEVNAECLSKGGSDYKSCVSTPLDEDEVLLLWLCKFEDDERVYSITLLGEDKKRGYCFIGDAVHVRENQDPPSLYDRSECLVVKGSAVSGLYDVKDQITAIVSIIG